MNFIDIASYQATIDLEKVFLLNPLDGVIVKSTQGYSTEDGVSKGYVNPYCDKWVQWLIKNDKPWGFYHFLAGRDPSAEAKWFISQTINYFNDGVPCADYEGGIVQSYGTYYLRRFLETVYDETGVKPLVYCNLSTIQGDVNGFRSIAEAGYKLWLAQYPNSKDQEGFREVPWQQGSYAPFKEITMHQYSDHGLLKGYGLIEVVEAVNGYGNEYSPSRYKKVGSNYLDLDKFYGTREDWDRLAGKVVNPVEPQVPDEPQTPDELNQMCREWIDFLKKDVEGLKSEITVKENKIKELEARTR